MLNFICTKSFTRSALKNALLFSVGFYLVQTGAMAMFLLFLLAVLVQGVVEFSDGIEAGLAIHEKQREYLTACVQQMIAEVEKIKRGAAK